MALYPKEFLERVISTANLADIIGQYTDLKPQGRDLIGRCPFPDHVEKTPSFHVTPDKQVFHCFGCKKGGGVIKFLELYNGMSFRESIDYLADRYRIPIPDLQNENSQQDKRKSDERKTILEINKLASHFFVENLVHQPKDSFVWKYIHQRGLTNESLSNFKIGFAGEEWDGLAQYLERKKVPMALAEKAGLVKQRTGGKSGYFDLFRNRLMFTIQSQSGDVIGFGGRILGEGQPKYLNSPETPVFSKGKSLYGLNHSAKFARSNDQVIVVEGYMDLIGLYQSGITQVVAPLGTALTSDHCRLLERITRNVVILFDGDSAGQAAAERSLPILLESGSYPKGLTLSDGLDPDEYILKHGADALKKAIEQSKDLFTVILDKYLEGFRGDATEKMKLVTKLKPILNAIKENSLKSLYLRQVAKKINDDPRWLAEAISVKENGVGFIGKPIEAQVIEKETISAVQDESPPMPSVIGASKAELLALGFLFLGKKGYWDQLLHADFMQKISHVGVAQVLEKAKELSGHSDQKSATLVSLLANQIEGVHLLTQAVNEIPKDNSEREEKLFADCVRKIHLGHLESQIKQLANTIKLNPSDEMMEQLRDLQRQKLLFVKESL